MEPVFIFAIFFGVIVLCVIFLIIAIFVIAPGSKGATGKVGEKGITGDTGIQGIQGPQGERGTSVGSYKGWTGATGTIGNTGDRGWTGATGDRGWTGATGITGLNYYPTAIFNNDTVWSITPGFTGSTGGVGESIIVDGWTGTYNLFNSFTTSNTYITTSLAGSTNFNVIVTGNILNYDETSNQKLEIVLDESGALDTAEVIVRPNYINGINEFSAQMSINPVDKFQVQLTNKSELFTGDTSPNPEYYKLQISNVNIFIQGT